LIVALNCIPPIRDDREYVNQEDLTKAAHKVGEAKKHASEALGLVFRDLGIQ
jgi:ATP-dependent 26S proteasome regulatory subunit